MWTANLSYLAPEVVASGGNEPPPMAAFWSQPAVQAPVNVAPSPTLTPTQTPAPIPAVVIPVQPTPAAELPAAYTPQSYNTPTPPAANTVSVPTTASNAGFLPASIMQTANTANNTIDAVTGGTAIAALPVSSGLDPLTLIALAAAGYYFLIYKKGGR